MDIANFISPRQLIEMKREIVEQALARANPIMAREYCDGILIMAENPSDSLSKTSELYDRIVFAGTGVYNDYERLRRAGVQYADLKGFSYSRRDVKAKSLASEFSHILGETFARQQLPWEVEILVVELGDAPSENRMYVILYSGGLVEAKRFCVIGDIVSRDGELQKNVLRKKLEEHEFQPDASLEEAFKSGYDSLVAVRENGEGIKPDHLEVVTLDRTVKRQRKMRRLSVAEVERLIPEASES